MTGIVDAAMKGSISEIRQLLAAGANPNSLGAGENTALHEAVRHGHSHVAAFLLASGVDCSLRNAEGKLALSTEFTTLQTLHRIRQEYQRWPVPPCNTTGPNSEGVESHVEQLDRDGVRRIEGFVETGELMRMQSDFSRMVRRLKVRGRQFVHYDQDEYWHPNHRAYVTNDALRYSADLAVLCCNPVIVEMANRYLRKTAHIKRVYGMRYLPSQTVRSNQFGWHHDMEDRQLKLMILLTDVGDGDQYMTYVRGSHSAFHPYPRFLENRLDFDYCRTYLDDVEIVKLTGRAGDVFLFDSNGMHRGNRSNGRVRDAFFVEFTADRNENNLWGSDLSRDDRCPSLRVSGNPLEQMLAVAPKWKRAENQPSRTRPSWAESLEDPRSWL